ncbi:MAG TPA: response regulator transcription factor [Anaerolineae bacterium]|nr:response regulator transcription factor [Anaerolineae bacterium]
MTTTSTIRILIVDDLAVVRSGLKLFIRAFDDLELVGEAASGDEAVRLCGPIRPDVVLLDLDMPGLCSVATMRLIRYEYPQIQVVAMSSFQGESMLQNMLDNGAIGCLLKNISSDDLASAIRVAYQQPRPEREATEPIFSPRPNVPCKGLTCPWGWNCRPTND